MTFRDWTLFLCVTLYSSQKHSLSFTQPLRSVPQDPTTPYTIPQTIKLQELRKIYTFAALASDPFRVPVFHDNIMIDVTSDELTFDNIHRLNLLEELNCHKAG